MEADPAPTKIKEITPLPFMKMDHGGKDPAKEISKKVGNLDDVHLFSNQILLGVYELPQRTQSGIELPDRYRAESEHQGKAMLVLKKGPTAFVSDGNYSFHEDDNVEVGDWLAIWVTDGRKIVINGQLCRIIRDTAIVAKIPSPDCIW